MKTYSPKPEHIERRWYVIDAGEQVLGRVASEAAVILRGKHKPIYAPHMDVGDNVIIVNAAKVVLTGGKETKKIAWRHSGHPGGITGTLYEDLLAKRPAFAVEKAVRGMLPKNRLGRAMIKKLHVLAGPEHPHVAQKPEEWRMGTRPAWTGLPAAPAPNGKRAKKKTGTDQAEAETVAPKKPTARKTSAAKPAAKKPTARKPTTRKTTASARTTASKKTTSKKTTAAKTTASKKSTAAKSKKPKTEKES